MINIFNLLATYILPLSILIPIIAGIMKYKYLTLPLKLIFYMMIIYAIMNGIQIILLTQHKVTKVSGDVLVLFDFPIISVFYSLILNKKWKIPVLMVAALYVIFWVADLFIEANSPTNVYPPAFESIFIMLYAMIYMKQQTETNIEKSWSENSLNWVNSGLLIYFASTLLMFTFYNTMLKMHVNLIVFMVLMIINDITLITELVLFAIGFNKCKQ